MLVSFSDFPQALTSMLSDSAARKESGFRCRQFCDGNFSLDAVVDKFEDVLTEAVEERHSV